MIEKLIGEKYLFELEIKPRRKKFDFHLYAIDRRTFHYSNINDLTTVLSWLGIEDEDPLVEDKCWTISERKMREYRRIICESLKSKNSLTYLEYRLDEDRVCGEWANRLQIEG